MARYELLSVKSPSVEITIGSETFQSKPIADTDKNPNFSDPLVFRDLVSVSLNCLSQLLHHEYFIMLSFLSDK